MLPFTVLQDGPIRPALLRSRQDIGAGPVARDVPDRAVCMCDPKLNAYPSKVPPRQAAAVCGVPWLSVER